jgi:hypothetical protein
MPESSQDPVAHKFFTDIMPDIACRDVFFAFGNIALR